MRSAQPILVKRYAASRLYDTSKGRYVSLDELRAWKERGIPFEVREAETGEDVSLVLMA
jgi:polyhydroxyalkanoate synthesis regulator protein